MNEDTERGDEREEHPEGMMLRMFVRFADWLLSPGFTGFSRIAHIFWFIGGLLMYLGFLPLMAWFGYCCWMRIVGDMMLSGFMLFVCVLMSNVTLVVSSKMLTTESILAKQQGRDLEF